jgi:hypothetical protein
MYSYRLQIEWHYKQGNKQANKQTKTSVQLHISGMGGKPAAELLGVKLWIYWLTFLYFVPGHHVEMYASWIITASANYSSTHSPYFTRCFKAYMEPVDTWWWHANYPHTSDREHQYPPWLRDEGLQEPVWGYTEYFPWQSAYQRYSHHTAASTSDIR